MFGPVLRGERVILRPPEDGDAEKFIEWLADMEVTRYMGARSPLTLEAERKWLKEVGESDSAVFWAIEAEGRTIGSTSIARIDWIHGNAITGTLIGDKAAWRRGFGREAMALRTDYAFRWLNLHKLNSTAFVENEPSRRALRRAGYREIGVQREQSFSEARWHDHVLLEVLRSEWEAARAGGVTRAGRGLHSPP